MGQTTKWQRKEASS